MKIKRNELTFNKLVSAIQKLDKELSFQANRAINISLTLRNWLIGYCIAEFELRGADRAAYGENLLLKLAATLTRSSVSNCNRRQLYRYLRFYKLYPGIVGTLSPQLKKFLPIRKVHALKVGTVSPQLQIPPKQLIQCLSYSHLEHILDLEDDRLELPKKEEMQRFIEEQLRERRNDE